jgi:hypothetical protein
MKRLLPLFGRTSLPLKTGILPLTMLVVFATLPALRARENRLELPLILNEERAAFRARRGGITLSESRYYERIVVFGHLEMFGPPVDYEPVGLHLDPTWSIRPERPVDLSPPAKGKIRAGGGTTKDIVPLHWLAEPLSGFSNRYVLMSARLEKRLCHDFRVAGSSSENVEALGKLLEQEGVEAKLLPDDAYVLIEAPGKERLFSYESSGRPRAAIYEKEREAWLVRNKNYIPQGLIYQPVKQPPEDYPKRDTRVRHAAAALARITGKEVFVQPAVEKREFKPLQNSGPLDTPEQQITQIERQLERAYVDVVELSPHCLALIVKNGKIKSLAELR